jgi:hypothetical protein
MRTPLSVSARPSGVAGALRRRDVAVGGRREPQRGVEQFAGLGVEVARQVPGSVEGLGELQPVAADSGGGAVGAVVDDVVDECGQAPDRGFGLDDVGAGELFDDGGVEFHQHR